MISLDASETLALKALDWLSRQEELWPVFLGSTGGSAADVMEQVNEPEFLAAILDFIVMDDAWVLGFCEGTGYAPGDPMAARAVLSGEDKAQWD